MISLPNELLYQIIYFTENKDLGPYLYVCKHTFHLVRHRVYRKVLFPDNVTQNDIITFCENYGSSIETIKLPLGKQYPEALYRFILETCPNMDFLQSSIQPKQLNRLIPLVKPSTCFMVTHMPLDNEQIEEQQQHQHYHGFYSNNAMDMDMFHSPFQTVTLFPCCPSFFIFPNEGIPEKMSTLTQISHYFHHPGALSNAILPTFGSDLLSLTLNPYDILTASVARLIVSKCPRLRYLGAPSVKAEGLWMLLRWCHTLSTIIVGEDDNLLTEEDMEEEEEEEAMIGQRQRRIIQDENERAVATVKQHKRVWCVHSCVSQAINERKRVSWHIGIVPKF